MTSAAKAAWPGEVLPSAGTPPHPDVSANSYIGNTIGCWGWDKAGWPRVGMIYLLSGGGSDRDFGAWKKFMPYSENWDKLLNFFLFQSLLKIRDKRCLAGLCFWDCTWKYISLAQLTVAKFSLNLISIIFLSFIYAIYFLAVMGLHCCPWAFSSYGEWGLFFVVLHRLLIAVDSSVVEHRLQGVQASAVVALGLSAPRHVGSSRTRGGNLARAGGFFITGPTGKPLISIIYYDVLSKTTRFLPWHFCMSLSEGLECLPTALQSTANLAACNQMPFTFPFRKMKVKVAQSCLTLYSPWNSLGQSTGVGSLSLLQRIFPPQGLNPGLWHWRRLLYQLSHRGSPLGR